jgi:hypothetical protein
MVTYQTMDAALHIPSDSAFTVILQEGWRTFMTARAQIVDNFRRNSLAWPWKFLTVKLGLGAYHHNFKYYYIIYYNCILLFL